MDTRWEELQEMKRRLAVQIGDLRARTREVVADALRVQQESRRVRSDAAELRVEVNNRRLSVGQRLGFRPIGRAASGSRILRRARPSEHPHAAEIIALHELHAEHERSAGRDESAAKAQGRADRIRRLVDRERT